jgi:hypothetical protein
MDILDELDNRERRLKTKGYLGIFVQWVFLDKSGDQVTMKRKQIPTPAQRLGEWNGLADELDRLFMQYRAELRAIATMKVACHVANAVRWHKNVMPDALVDPRFIRLNKAGDHVRILRRYVEQSRSALDRDSTRRGRRGVINIEPLNLRLPDTIEEVREAVERQQRSVWPHGRLAVADLAVIASPVPILVVATLGADFFGHLPKLIETRA